MAFENVATTGYGGKDLNILSKALLELQAFTISGPLTGAAASTVIAVTEHGGIDLPDTIIKVLSFASGAFTDITSTTSIVDTRAKGTLTLASVVAGDTCVVAGVTFTFVAVTVTPSTNLTPGQVAVGSTDTASAANLAAAISTQVKGLQATSSGAVVTVINQTEGTGGNATTIVGDAHITASGATLAGGSATYGVISTTNTTSAEVFVFWFKDVA